MADNSAIARTDATWNPSGRPAVECQRHTGINVHRHQTTDQRGDAAWSNRCVTHVQPDGHPTFNGGNR
jgi:hypothetical protein